MEVTDKLIDHLAHLSKLQFDDLEKAEIKKDLEQMIEFVNKLQEVDTEGIEPLMHMSSEMNVLRNDEVLQDITREEALQNAPVTDGVFIKVPKVIDKG